MTTAVERVREAFQNKNYQLKRDGRFAVLNVSAAKTAVSGATGHSLRINHIPFSDDPSHSGILGYASDDLAVAVELAALLTPQDVHPAVT